MKKLFIFTILLTVQASLYAATDNLITSCMGGFNGVRDLVLMVDKDFAVTKSSKAILINQTEWRRHDESEGFFVFKKSSLKYFTDEYVLLIVSKDGKNISIYTSYIVEKGNSFEMEEFKCSGF
jgi:hypothetical protein